MSFNLSPTTLVLACSVVVLLTRVFRKNARPPLPPGPPGLPLIGNALQLPTHHEWFTFAEWGKAFGGIVHVSAFGQPLIILNSVNAINDLLEGRSKIFSDRPKLPMAGELVGYEDSPPLCAYGNRHREYRKLMNGGLALSKMSALYPIQEQKMRAFLLDLLTSPDNFRLHIRNIVASVVFQASHGYTVSGENDPLVTLAEKATFEFSAASAPGAFLIDLLPVLRYVPEWFPGAGFKKTAKLYRQTAMQLKDEPYQVVKQRVAQGTAVPSFTSDLIEKYPNPTPEQEEVFKWASTALYSGGADTTVSAITSFFLAMVLHPDVQKKAQDEIDRVVGPTRLPTFSDRKNLPYINALIKEIHRWNPVAPLALPHRLTQDDIYDGYFLPAGSIVFANIWGIFRDPELFESPEEFKPERYLNARAAVIDPSSIAFGFGRRVCPGQHLADSSLYLAVVSTLALFEMKNAIDRTTGLPIVPVPNYKTGIISHPEAFECLVKPRYSEADILAHLGHA